MIENERRLIDLNEEELREIIAEEVRELLYHAVKEIPSQQAPNIVSGRKNIAQALGIGIDKLDELVNDGTFKNAVKKNGRVMICDINRAFDDFNDKWNRDY